MWILLTSCAAPVDGPLPDVLAPFVAPGPHAVGYVERDASWTEPPLQGEPRNLRLAHWYPAAEATGGIVRYLGVNEAENVYLDAPVLAGRHPVVVFSHGHQGFAENSSFIAEHLASHGWNVIAPEHAGNTVLDGSDRETAIYWQRPIDVSAALDALDADIAVAVGHSFGGYTVHALAGATFDIDALLPGCLSGADDSDFCSTMDDPQADRFRTGFRDPRVVAVVSMAPGDARLYGEGMADNQVPVLLLTGGLDSGTNGDEVWGYLAHPGDVRIHLPQVGHNGFTDFSALDPAEARDPEVVEPVVRGMVHAFAHAAVTGDDRAFHTVLDGGLGEDAEVSLP